MVADFEESSILGEIQNLEDEIKAVENALQRILPMRENLSLVRLVSRLKDLKYHQEMRLKIHRQRVKESGIKY